MRHITEQNGWDPRDLRLAKALAETASRVRVGATVELHSPTRACSKCHSSTSVLVRPGNICSSCWSLGLLRGKVRPAGRLRHARP